MLTLNLSNTQAKKIKKSIKRNKMLNKVEKENLLKLFESVDMVTYKIYQDDKFINEFEKTGLVEFTKNYLLNKYENIKIEKFNTQQAIKCLKKEGFYVEKITDENEN